MNCAYFLHFGHLRALYQAPISGIFAVCTSAFGSISALHIPPTLYLCCSPLTGLCQHIPLEYKGKILGGIAGIFIGDLLGLPLGGLAGFVAGSLLGHLIVDAPQAGQSDDDAYKAYKRRQGMFLYHLFTLGARIARADAPINRLEINHMEQLMRQQFKLSQEGRKHAIGVWNRAKSAPESYEALAQAFYTEFKRERHHVMNMLDFLFSLAAADGNLHPEEDKMLLRTAGLFHIGRMQYERVKGRYYQPPPSERRRWTPLDPHYAILGAEPQDSIATVKAKFRKLAMQWHPDKVAARSASMEVIRHAQEKFQQINEAYERILEARGAK